MSSFSYYQPRPSRGKDLSRVATEVGRAAQDILGTWPLQDLVDAVSERVLGQDEAVGQLCTITLGWLLRCARIGQGVDAQALPRTRALAMNGPTGCGKTHLVRTISKVLDVPMCVIDGSQLTGAGWYGHDVDAELARAAQMMLDTKRPTIVFVDEADKLVKGHRDDSDRGFDPTTNFLTAMENDDAISAGRSDEAPASMLLYVFAGAFTGIEDIVRRRLHLGGRAGFTGGYDDIDEAELRRQVIPSDLETWGYPREFCGRMAAFVQVRQLDEEDLARIVCTSVRARYDTELGDIGFDVTEGAVALVTHEAALSGHGARGIEEALGLVCQRAVIEARQSEDVTKVTLKADGDTIVCDLERGARAVTEERDTRVWTSELATLDMGLDKLLGLVARHEGGRYLKDDSDEERALLSSELVSSLLGGTCAPDVIFAAEELLLCCLAYIRDWSQVDLPDTRLFADVLQACANGGRMEGTVWTILLGDACSRGYMGCQDRLPLSHVNNTTGLRIQAGTSHIRPMQDACVTHWFAFRQACASSHDPARSQDAVVQLLDESLAAAASSQGAGRTLA